MIQISKLNNKAASLVEYMVLLSLIGGVGLFAVVGFGVQINTAYADITEGVSQTDEQIENDYGAICVHTSPWVGNGAGGYEGFAMHLQRGIWFSDGVPAPAQTTSGIDITIVVNDTNGNGMIDATEMQGVGNANWYSDGDLLASISIANPTTVAGTYRPSQWVDTNGDSYVDGGDLISPLPQSGWSLNPSSLMAPDLEAGCITS